MIEGHNNDGVTVLLNPREVIEVYRGANYCNVKMSNGTLHRFSGNQAARVYEALRSAAI